MSQPDFTFSVNFSGDSDEWDTLCRIVGTTSNTLARDGMMPHVGEFIARRRGDPLALTDVADIGGHMVSPIAYGLARARGCDPAAIALLGTIKCRIDVEDPDTGVRVEVRVHDGDHGREIRMLLPFLPGLYWRGMSNGDSDAQIRMRRNETGIPDTILAIMPDRIVGRPLRETFSHPVLDGYDLVVNRMVAITAASENWLIGVDGAPPMAPLRTIAF